ncbi:MAG: hypothetical protein ACOYNI_12750 [Acidimicrobiia bacterium]
MAIALFGVVLLALSNAPWRAFVPVTMKASVPVPATPATQGTLAGRDGYAVSGRVLIGGQPGDRGLWLRAYSARPLRDPQLFVTAAPAAFVGTARPKDSLAVGRVPGSSGDTSFPLPAGVDLAQLRTAIVYDGGVDRVVAVAALESNERR